VRRSVAEGQLGAVPSLNPTACPLAKGGEWKVKKRREGSCDPLSLYSAHTSIGLATALPVPTQPRSRNATANVAWHQNCMAVAVSPILA
jgi:hypothetical protein